jgi:glycosyltransferase involved in cell wall biosynthesis
MNVLILQDYLSKAGGGERFALRLARDFNAVVKCLDYNPKVQDELGFNDVQVKEIGKTPNLIGLKQTLTSLKYRNLSISGYDLHIFSGNWCQLAAKRHHPNIWYCHTPPRLLYDLNETYKKKLHPIVQPLFRKWCGWLKAMDQENAKDIDIIIANSENTKERIRKFYCMEVEVIHAPVDTGKYMNNKAEDFWLSVNRIYPEKRIELQLEAFRMMPDKRLKIVGPIGGTYAESLLQKLPNNVTYLGALDDEYLTDLYSRCRGLVCTSADEDFGITAIEAMASGKPVIAVDEGGYRETVVDGVTGRLTASDAKSRAEAISEVDEDVEGYQFACQKRAAEYDTFVFNKKFGKVVESVI